MNWWQDEREKRQFARWMVRKGYLETREDVLDFLETPFNMGPFTIRKLRAEYEAEQGVPL